MDRTDTMQFHDFIFRYNPRAITVTHAAGAAVHFCPGRGEVVQQLGDRCRTVSCQGAFLGDNFQDAAGQMEQFRRCAQKAGAGSLFLPGMAPFPAYLREFTVEATGDGRILPYTMVFLEAGVGA